MYFILSLMMIGAMLCSSLKTSDVLEVKAAEAWVPGMVTTDVGGINEKSLISCFLGQRYERMGGGEKTRLILNSLGIICFYIKRLIFNA